jgi:hypothetical protein
MARAMSKGISWRQREMLMQLAGLDYDPVAWRDLDFGPGFEEAINDPTVAWNREAVDATLPAQPRSSRAVELGSYSFMPIAEMRHGALA